MTTQPFIYEYDYDKKATGTQDTGAQIRVSPPMCILPSVMPGRSRHLAPALVGTAEKLPLDDKSVDASMAMVTIHHWADMEKGLLEIKRVTRQRALIMTFDGDALHEFWNIRYFPEVVAMEKRRYPAIDWMTGILGGRCQVQPIPIPLDCVDGFQEAFYGRPEAFLDKEVRKAQSAWGFLSEEQQEVLVEHLAADLRSGNWDKKFGHLRSQPWFPGALRLIIVDLIPQPM
jgi:SAM-dependent methyltransferase